MNQTSGIIKLSQALLKAQKAMGAATKGAANPFFKSKYADYGAVLEVVKEPLNEAGVVILQPHSSDATGDYVHTMLIHAESGESISSTTKVVCAKQNDPQALGSAITYARRYGLQSLLSVPTEDDDGNAGSGKAYSAPAKATPVPAAKAETKEQKIAKADAAIAGVTATPKAEPKKEEPKAQPAVATKVMAGW